MDKICKIRNKIGKFQDQNSTEILNRLGLTFYFSKFLFRIFSYEKKQLLRSNLNICCDRILIGKQDF